VTSYLIRRLFQASCVLDRSRCPLAEPVEMGCKLASRLEIIFGQQIVRYY
jgi:hypothetical protein